ncbi:SDR family NAD(P)-dependent oxidoreductase [Kosakonia oryziphila]|uniref:SDR family NAD(P)-dependent oxidoreductase n=1 Tax=Kosakonia oryziphila TaxID=1005667 RepID=UPI003CC5749F
MHWRKKRCFSSIAEEHEIIYTLNITALMCLTLAALPRFVENDRGVIINIASVLAFHARAGSALYRLFIQLRLLNMRFVLGEQSFR